MTQFKWDSLFPTKKKKNACVYNLLLIFHGQYLSKVYTFKPLFDPKYFSFEKVSVKRCYTKNKVIFWVYFIINWQVFGLLFKYFPLLEITSQYFRQNILQPSFTHRKFKIKRKKKKKGSAVGMAFLDIQINYFLTIKVASEAERTGKMT